MFDALDNIFTTFKIYFKDGIDKCFGLCVPPLTANNPEFA